MGSEEFDARRRRYLDRMNALKKSIRKRRPPKDKGGSETVAVEPNRPKLGEGGAAAELEFDE
jgi:hypothetical protein